MVFVAARSQARLPSSKPTLAQRTRKTVAFRAVRAQAESDGGLLSYASTRMNHISKHFPSALSAEDFLARVEMALSAHGMTGANSIPVVNLCRDESTGLFKGMVSNALGKPFNINGLGAGISCGCLGFKAGFSHSPVENGKERYIFMSFPHIGIASDGKLGSIHRPGREPASTACGAMIAILAAFKADAANMSKFTDTTHDPMDPELSFLMTLLAKRVAAEKSDVKTMDLVAFTQLAERAITEQLEDMINDTVDTSKADYAVVTGVHVHNWGNEGTGEPSYEWIAPNKTYVVVDGKKLSINLSAVPALTPRQLRILSGELAPPLAAAYVKDTTVVETKFTDPAAAV